MRKTKAEKGITLVALIITIVVLLILAVVAISAIKNDGILGHAENATYQQAKSEADETIKLVMDEWEIVKYNQSGKTLETFLNEKKTEGTLSSVTQSGDNFILEVVKGGTTFGTTINKDGKIEGEVGEVLAKPIYSDVKVVANADGTGEAISASKKAEGTKLYINFAHSVEGGTTSVTPSIPFEVTANGEHEFTITGTVNGQTTETKLKVTVNQYAPTIAIGTYIEYNVPYTMTANNGYVSKYTSKNGWRYWGLDDAGNHMLISAGSPLNLNIDTSAVNVDRIENGETIQGGWWGTSSEASSDDPLIRAVYGLKNKFPYITFVHSGETRGGNEGWYYEIKGQSEGKLSADAFATDEYPEAKITIPTAADCLRSTETKEIMGERLCSILVGGFGINWGFPARGDLVSGK